MLDVICCVANNRAHAGLVVKSGMRYGARLPGRVYHPPYFADQDWRRPDRSAYMASLRALRPTVATVLDVERREQVAEALDWAEEAAQYVERVVLIPKVSGVISSLPRRIGGADIVLGYSIPTRHGGAAVWPGEFAGWPVHLLGGAPHRQMRHYVRFRSMCDVLSVDGNMALKMSHACMFWSPVRGIHGSHWRKLSEVGINVASGAHLVAFEMSCRTILDAWAELAGMANRPPMEISAPLMTVAPPA